MKIISTAFRWYFSQTITPTWIIWFIDLLLCIFPGYVFTYLQLGRVEFWEQIIPITIGAILASLVYMVMFRLLHIHSSMVRFATTYDLRRVVLAIIFGSCIMLVNEILMRYLHIDHLITHPNIPFGLCSAALCALLLCTFRLTVRAAYESYRFSEHTPRAFVYGVKAGGQVIAQNITLADNARYKLAGFIAPEGDFSSRKLLGVTVYHDNPRAVERMKEQRASVLLVSPNQSEHISQRTDLVDALIQAGIKIMMVPPAEHWDGHSSLNANQLKQVEIEDLLPRDKIEVDMQAIGQMLTGQRILITGAAGSIGSEMSRQVARFNPSELILVDQAETSMHDVRLYMAQHHPQLSVWTIVGSINNPEHMQRLFHEHRPQYVFHAAAYKHVPMMEDNPAMAVQNNIYGTRVIADLAVRYGTKKFVMISTDKAVNPTNVMGCSKRICEIYCQALNQQILQQQTHPGAKPLTTIDGELAFTQFITTRFGNVLGSNGSVIPIFREQIRRGGPVKVTHPEITRFFMLIPEACRLVLEAGTMGQGGEIFVFDMGQPVKIVDLARRMIRLSGAKNIKIEFSGLREGEKLYEEVLNDAEQTKPTHHPKIKVAATRQYPYDLALQNEEQLHELSFTFDDMAIVKKMKEIVPEYKSNNSKYSVLDQ